MNRLRSRAGYTLTEMLVVIGIIGLLAAALTPILVGQLGRARAKSVRLQMENVLTSLESFRSDVGRYPTQDEGLRVLVVEPETGDGWLGPYLRSEDALADPWGNPIAYELAENNQPRVVSLGSDGEEGGRGVAADVILP